MFASWRPWRLLLGAYLFGGVTILQLYAQGIGHVRRAGAGDVDAALSGDDRRADDHLGRPPWRGRFQAPACLGQSLSAFGLSKN